MTIILYGESAILDGLEIALRNAGNQEVLRLSSVHLPASMEGVTPGTIIYDPRHVSIPNLFRLFTHYAGWQLVGLTKRDKAWKVHGAKKSPVMLSSITECMHGINA